MSNLFNAFLDEKLMLKLIEAPVINFLNKQILEKLHQLIIDIHATEVLQKIKTVFLFCADFSLLVWLFHWDFCSIWLYVVNLTLRNSVMSVHVKSFPEEMLRWIANDWGFAASGRNKVRLNSTTFVSNVVNFSEYIALHVHSSMLWLLMT